MRKKKGLIVFILVIVILLIIMYFIKGHKEKDYLVFNENLFLSGGYGLYMLDDSAEVIESSEIANLFIDGKFTNASNILRELLKREDIKGNSQKELEVLNALGIIQTSHGNFEDAQIIYDQAFEYLDHNEQLENSCIAAKLYNNYAILIYGEFNKEQAIESCNKALGILEELDDPIAQLVVEANLIEFETGLRNQLVEAKNENIKPAEQILRKERDLLGSNQIIGVHMYLLLSDTYTGLSKYSKAESSLRKAELIIKKGGKMYRLLGFSQELSTGVLYLSRGDYDEAVRQFRNAYDEAEPLLGNKNHLVAYLSRNLGAVYLHMDEDALGLEYSIRALEGFSNYRSRRGLWGNIATAYYSLNEYKEAEKYAFMAYNAAIEMEHVSTEKYRKLLEFIYESRKITEVFEDWLEDGLENTDILN